MRISTTLLLASTVCISFQVNAKTVQFQSPDQMTSEIKVFLSLQFGATNSVDFRIDRRLRLKKCPEKLAIDMHRRDGVLVKCHSLGWKLSVPLHNSSKSKSSTSDRAIIRGQTVRLGIRKSGFVISRSMIADRSGKVGEFIPVRASRRSQPIMTQISAPGQVILASN